LTISLDRNHQLREHISTNLGNFEAHEILYAERKHAAVAIAIVDCRESPNLGGMPYDPCAAGHAAILLTIRASRLRNHAGQRAFPGGRMDPGETPEQTALRELEEEVGLELDASSVLGRLDDYATRSGFVITPVVVWGGKPRQLKANPDEVESIHRIPISELMREDAPILESIPESEHPVLKMPVGNDWFAAPTAAMAYQFREVAILGKKTRVAHFEQPYFAWR
jgi:mutator protein MutT